MERKESDSLYWWLSVADVQTAKKLGAPLASWPMSLIRMFRRAKLFAAINTDAPTNLPTKEALRRWSYPIAVEPEDIPHIIGWPGIIANKHLAIPEFAETDLGLDIIKARFEALRLGVPEVRSDVLSHYQYALDTEQQRHKPTVEQT